jgi:poly-gamma-glutamate synthesis protein (capsule biosynthesis protein)
MLRQSFGLSGNPDVVERLRGYIDWPQSNRDEGRLTVLVMTGTTALARDVTWKMEQNGMQYPALEIGDWLRDADFTHISHEVVFSEICPTPAPQRHTLRFCGLPRHRELLEFVGVDVIELTGNHILDYGRPAFLETLMGYRELGWGTFGGGADLSDALQAYTVEHNGNRIVFMGCNEAGPENVWASEDLPGAAPCDMEYFSAALQEQREQGAITIFTFQWLESMTVLPAQKKAFREAVDAGAMIVSGSQAHQPQGMEFYAGGFIHYGLGNLFFDQMQTLDYRRELLDRHVFYDGRHISTELLTALLEDYSQPRPMTLVERSEFLTEIFQESGW